jgi:hypothetical protein
LCLKLSVSNKKKKKKRFYKPVILIPNQHINVDLEFYMTTTLWRALSQ